MTQIWKAVMLVRDGDMRLHTISVFSTEALAMAQAEQWQKQAGMDFQKSSYEGVDGNPVTVWMTADGIEQIEVSQGEVDALADHPFHNI